MKRLLVIITFALCAGTLFAQAEDRDVLVTPEGTVYSVESELSTDPGIAARSVIELSIQNGDSTSSGIVPDSVSQGTHTVPSLAYDTDSKTLFVLWLHMPNILSSELLLAAYKDGQWQPAFSIDSLPYHIRSNPRIAITRSVSQDLPDGTTVDVPALVIHLLYWDESGKGEEARYALISIDKGHISDPELHPVSDFYTDTDTPAPVDPAFNRQILKNPAFIENGSADSVDIVAGNLQTNTFHRVTIKPKLDTRIRIPVGRGGGMRIAAPATFTAPWTGRINVMGSVRGDGLAFTSVVPEGVSYIAYSAGTWGNVKAITTGPKISPDSALKALSKLIGSVQ
jgi:hypothetical protein